MAINETKRLKNDVVTADQNVLKAIRDFADYTPANHECTVDKLTLKCDHMVAMQDAELRARIAFDSARDACVQAEWDFHNAILTAKMQVLAQYGDNSDQIQALGLKKKTERKRPTRTGQKKTPPKQE